MHAAVAVKYAATGLERAHMGCGVWHKAAAVLTRNRYTGLGLGDEGADSYSHGEEEEAVVVPQDREMGTSHCGEHCRMWFVARRAQYMVVQESHRVCELGALAAHGHHSGAQHAGVDAAKYREGDRAFEELVPSYVARRKARVEYRARAQLQIQAEEEAPDS